jgi:MFS family permease
MMRNVRLLELHSIFWSVLFILPVMIPFYRDHLGLSFQDFLIGEAVFAATVVALEVPSGWLSDVWKRKYVLALGSVFWFLGFGYLYFCKTLLDTIVAQAIIGIAVSLFSGTATALLYDTLLAEGRTEQYSRLEGRRFGFGFYSCAVGAVMGGFMYAVDPALPLLATIASAVPATICCLLMAEPPRLKSAIQGHPIKDMAITMRYALHGHKEVAFIIIFAGLLFSGTKLIMWSQQPYYMTLDIPEYYYGFLMAVGFTLSAVASTLAHKLDGKISNLRTLTFALITGLIVCIGAGSIIGLHGVALLMVGGSFLFGLSMPRVSDAINQRVTSDRRATILSTTNLLRELFFIPVAFVVGVAVTTGGVGYGLFTIAAWLSLAGLFIALWAWQRTKTSSLVRS